MGQIHHPHRHPHPHPKRKENEGHHHPFVKKGKRPHELAHEHPIGFLYGRPKAPYSTAGVKRIWRFVYTWFPKAVSLGIFNCRKIAGSSSWSQHAWADALDVASPESVTTGRPDDYLQAIVEALEKRKGSLNITRVIFGDSSHLNHAHVDSEPDRTGTPPCAS